MFVIVDFEDNRKRRFEKYRKHTIETKRCDVLGSAPFFIAAAHAVYFDEQELVGIIKRCGTAIFRNGKIPPGFEKYKFTPSVLPLIMLVRSASQFFELNPGFGKNACVSIIDKNGYAADETVHLSRSVRFVRVVTERADIYYRAGQRAYRSFGAVISSGSDSSLAGGSDCVIALSDKEFYPPGAGCALVYSKSTVCDNVFVPRRSTFLYDGFETEACGIERFEFLCALFETCGLKIKEKPIFSDTKSILYKTFA